jgi:capsule polysaccharide export protein KpsE/RkpR
VLYELLARNNEVYKQIILFRRIISKVIKGDVKPLIGYFKHLKLESRLKEKDLEAILLELQNIVKYMQLNLYLEIIKY